MTDEEILQTAFPAQRWAVEGLIPEGVTVFAGKAKIGKSWAALNLALSVTDGSPVFGRFPVQRGDVLYLALEDSGRRMQDRLRQLMAGRESRPSGHLHIEVDWATADEGGLQELDMWLGDFPQARLVVIDVMRRFNPIGYSYSKDSDKIEALGNLGMKHHVGIVAVMHMYKGPGVSASSPDWMDKIQGSVGVTGAAQAVIGLSRARGAPEGVLRVSGKDVPEQDVPLRYDAESGTWSAGETTLGGYVPMTDERAEILRAIERQPGGEALEIARAIGKTYNSVRHLMWAMVQQGQLKRIAKRYYTPAQALAAGLEPDPWDSVTVTREVSESITLPITR